MEFDCQLSTIWLRHLAFHEMAHALQATFSFKDSDKWYVEALPEGLASYLNAKYYGIDWRGYGWVQDYFLKQLYRKILTIANRLTFALINMVRFSLTFPRNTVLKNCS